MFTSIEHVKEVTNYDVTNAEILRAQAIIESVVGRTEADVIGTADTGVLARATAFQTAYMHTNYDKVYEQVAFTNKSQTDASISMDTTMSAPFLAPLAVLALRRLSWVRSRSIKVGSLYGSGVPYVEWSVN